MKKFIVKYWWAPPVAAVVLILLNCIIMIANGLFRNLTVVESVVGYLELVLFLFIPVSWILLLVNKQKKKFFFSLLITILAVCPLFILECLTALYMPGPDDFGRKHGIPEGMEYTIPYPFDESSKQEATVDSLDTDTYLQIWDSSQGGIYQYDFYYGPLPAGEVFLRCYEATENIRLSANQFGEDRVYESSKVAIDSTFSFTKLVKHQRFSIYEGDWGDYYAARIEVWHKDAKTGEETKLLEKVYRVEGWER